MRDVFVAGTGTIRFGRYPELLLEDFALDAVTEAVADAGIEGRDLDVAVFGNSTVAAWLGNACCAKLGMTGTADPERRERLCRWRDCGARGLDGSRLGAAPTSPSWWAWRRWRRASSRPTLASTKRYLGKTLPAKYALRARKHMDQYGLTREQLAQVSVKNHHAGAMNPNAHYQEDVTLEQVLESRPIADPLTLLQCCPTTDGAAAVVLAAGPAAERLATRRSGSRRRSSPAAATRTRRRASSGRTKTSPRARGSPRTKWPGWGRRTLTLPRSTTRSPSARSSPTRISGSVSAARAGVSS